MNYGHILHYVARTPWAIAEEKLHDILSVLAFRAAGHVYTADEIRARIGDPQPAVASKQGVVAVIPLRGVIAHRMGTMEESSGGMSAERFTIMVRAAATDPAVNAILIDADSPGGTVPGVLEAAQAVFDAREQKRVVAIANAWMASAAYWIASQAHEIVAIPSAFDACIGSIGVLLVHEDLSEHLAKEGIKITIVRGGENKTRVNPFEPLTDEALAQLEAGAQATKARFVKDVARARGLTSAQVVERYGDGKAFSAADAKAAGLIDRIATFDDTVARLVGRGGRAAGGMQAEGEALPLVAADGAVANPDIPLGQITDGDADADRRRRFDRF